MADTEDTAVVDAPATSKEIDYSTMTTDQLLVEMGKAYEAKDMKLMGQIAKVHTATEKAEEKVKKDKLESKLQEIVGETLKEITSLVDKLVDAGKLDGAEGVWFAYDMGEKREKGINPACRLTKTSRRTSTGTSTGTGSYTPNDAKSKDVLDTEDDEGVKFGEHILFSVATERKIDKAAVTMPAGMTYREAYNYSTNGGWRNSVRMALLKEAGIIK